MSSNSDTRYFISYIFHITHLLLFFIQLVQLLTGDLPALPKRHFGEWSSNLDISQLISSTFHITPLLLLLLLFDQLRIGDLLYPDLPKATFQGIEHKVVALSDRYFFFLRVNKHLSVAHNIVKKVLKDKPPGGLLMTGAMWQKPKQEAPFQIMARLNVATHMTLEMIHNNFL